MDFKYEQVSISVYGFRRLKKEALKESSLLFGQISTLSAPLDLTTAGCP